MATTTDTLNIVIKTKATGDGAKKAKEGLDGLVQAAQAVAGAMAAQKVVQYSAELTKIGAEADRQANALDNLASAAGTSGDEITAAIREASDFTIDRMTAMQAANRAMIMDVADSPAEFERLATVATALGRAMGQDAAKSIDDFVTAAGRQSKLIADNLGLVVSAEDAYLRYAEANGIAVDEMADAAKKQAFLTEMLRQGELKMADLGDAALDNAGKIEQATATWETFTSIVGQGFSDAILDSSGSLSGLNVLLDQHGSKISDAISFALRHSTTLGTLDSLLSRVGRSTEDATKATVDAAAGQRMLSGEYERALPAKRELVTLTASEAELANTSAQAHGQYQAALTATATNQAAQAAAALELDAANRAAAQAAGEATAAQLSLAASLKDATDAQIAQAAISQLGAALSEGDITLEDYNTAVGQVQLTFGLATEESMRLSEGILGLTADLADGTLSASGYDEALLGLIGTTTDAATQTDQLAQELAALPSKKTIVVEYRRKVTGPNPPSGAPSGPSGDAPAPSPGGGGGPAPGSSGLVQSSGLLGTSLVTSGAGLMMGASARGGAMGGGVYIGNVTIVSDDPAVIWKKLERYARLKGKSGWQQLGR